ncbi:hypothetical protein NLG97_g2826 [Lecanicillium saksenae]|uniref:Uncharacterized protein n=1 Tax=Lecanicillium saksenae TaxID=468837 RepID=A0ACC1R371_9HYPO|nr:hypothetical protein NLG97_g2826 [Lecanicillium saksenae]
MRDDKLTDVHGFEQVDKNVELNTEYEAEFLEAHPQVFGTEAGDILNIYAQEEIRRSFLEVDQDKLSHLFKDGKLHDPDGELGVKAEATHLTTPETSLEDMRRTIKVLEKLANVWYNDKVAVPESMTEITRRRQTQALSDNEAIDKEPLNFSINRQLMAKSHFLKEVWAEVASIVGFEFARMLFGLRRNLYCAGCVPWESIDTDIVDRECAFYTAVAIVSVTQSHLCKLITRETICNIAAAWEPGMPLSQEILSGKLPPLPNGETLLKDFCQSLKNSAVEEQEGIASAAPSSLACVGAPQTPCRQSTPLSSAPRTVSNKRTRPVYDSSRMDIDLEEAEETPPPKTRAGWQDPY